MNLWSSLTTEVFMKKDINKRQPSDVQKKKFQEGGALGDRNEGGTQGQKENPQVKEKKK
jgi:hypothetical protein